MRVRFIVAAVLIQFLVLAWMAGEREMIYRTGRTVYLRTMPRDPHDLFRGDYVHLNYEISTIGKHLWRDGLKDRKQDNYSYSHVYRRIGPDSRVYTVLKIGDSGIAELQYVTDRKPGKDFFIRGRPQYARSTSMQVLYGIEAYFVQQDKGRELEQGMNRGDINVPMEMEAAVSGSGIAVLQGYRWSPIGIGLTVNTETNLSRARIPISADIKLLNASKTELAIVDLPNSSSFTLDPDFTQDWLRNEWRWIGAKPRPVVADENVKTLKPGEIHKAHIDFSDPTWFVVKDGEQPKSLSDLWNNTRDIRYRLVYRPPSKEECSSLKNASIIWHGSIASRAFSGGRID